MSNGAAPDGASDATPREEALHAAPNQAQRLPDDESRVMAAFLSELAERGWRDTTLLGVAGRAAMGIADLYPRFADKPALVDAFLRSTDRAMLAFDEADLEGQGHRERLFDILMRRLDVLVPHRAAAREIGRAALRDPRLALVMRHGLLRAMGWAIQAAGLDRSGLRGALRIRAVGQAYLRAMRVWYDDDDQSSRTMAELDRRLVAIDRLLGAPRGEAPGA
ncbi:hypothetical protein [Zavarzinia sp. CC-PAN008]|uniref:hypothetical protein n=1 Tax=Zavarzinia sp. CC-PAN008 TaxID=3243332 RepID=UPI003F742248